MSESASLLCAKVHNGRRRSRKVRMFFILVYVYNFVIQVAESDFGGVFDGVDAVARGDTLFEGFVVVALGWRHIENDVNASLVQCHGVERGEDAVIFEFYGFGMRHTVAINRHIVHYGDVNNLFATVEIIVDSLCRRRHRLQKSVLVVGVLPKSRHGLLITGGVDVCLAVCGRHADACVFEHAAHAAHRMTLEVGEVYHEVVIFQMCAHDVAFDVGIVLHGDFKFAFLVHQIDLEHRRKTVVFDGLPMLLECGSLAAVCGVALHDGAAHGFDEVFDEVGLR